MSDRRQQILQVLVSFPFDSRVYLELFMRSDATAEQVEACCKAASVYGRDGCPFTAWQMVNDLIELVP